MKNKTVKIIGAGNVALQHARELFFLNARLIFDDIDLSKVNFLQNIFSTSLAKKNITFIICKIFSKLFSRNKFPESLWLKFKIFY